jgi:hypothetical protein
MSSLAKTLCRWYWTVRGLMNSCAPYLRVGEAVAGEPSDVRLLGCGGRARHGALARGLATGQELATGALGEDVSPDAAERVVGGSELLTRGQAPVLATQPFAVHELGPGEVRSDAAVGQPLDRLLVQGSGGYSASRPLRVVCVPITPTPKITPAPTCHPSREPLVRCARD